MTESQKRARILSALDYYERTLRKRTDGDRSEGTVKRVRTELAKAIDEAFAAPAPVAPQDDARDAAGIERAARYVEKLADGYADEHGRYDHETGATEFSDAGLEYHSTLCELAEGIRALSTPAAKPTEPTLPTQGDAK